MYFWKYYFISKQFSPLVILLNLLFLQFNERYAVIRTTKLNYNIVLVFSRTTTVDHNIIILLVLVFIIIKMEKLLGHQTSSINKPRFIKSDYEDEPNEKTFFIINYFLF